MPEHRGKRGSRADQKAGRINKIDVQALSAKPPSPVQIRAAPPKFLVRTHRLFLGDTCKHFRVFPSYARRNVPSVQMSDPERFARAGVRRGGGLQDFHLQPLAVPRIMRISRKLRCAPARSASVPLAQVSAVSSTLEPAKHLSSITSARRGSLAPGSSPVWAATEFCAAVTTTISSAARHSDPRGLRVAPGRTTRRWPRRAGAPPRQRT